MIFRYPGGKNKVANLLLQYLPPNTKEIRDCMVGGGGLFFSCPLGLQTWINDLNPSLIEVYRALQERPADFIAKCREILPVQDGEEEVSTKCKGKKYNKRLKDVFDSFAWDTEMDQALRYFFLNRTVWMGRVNLNPSFKSRMYYSNPSGWNIVKTQKLEKAALHLCGTKITNVDYSILLQEPGENIWCYLDAPYKIDTDLSPKSKLYQFGFSDSDHKRFADECKKTKHQICISYDDDKEGFIRGLFRPEDGFRIYTHSWTYSGTQTKGEVIQAAKFLETNKELPEEDKIKVKKTGKELIITNYERDESRFGREEVGQINFA